MVWKKSAAPALFFFLTICVALADSPPPIPGFKANREEIRFGLGFAQLVAEQCPEYRAGPKFDQMMKLLRFGAEVGGRQFDEPKFLAEVKQEAAETMQGKDVCQKAAEVADPEGIIAPVK